MERDEYVELVDVSRRVIVGSYFRRHGHIVVGTKGRRDWGDG